MDNDEIEVGEYIRSKDGYIDKVERIVYDELEKKNYYACEKSVMASGFKEDIAKHRKNIIDLVEARRLCEWNIGNGQRRYFALYRNKRDR